MNMENKLPVTIKLSKKQVSYWQQLINALKQVNKGEIKINDKTTIDTMQKDFKITIEEVKNDKENI